MTKPKSAVKDDTVDRSMTPNNMDESIEEGTQSINDTQSRK